MDIADLDRSNNVYERMNNLQVHLRLLIRLGNHDKWHVVSLGPLYNMTKGCDRQILRALETHLEAVSWKLEIELCVVTGL